MTEMYGGGERCARVIVITKPAVPTDLLHGQSFPRLCCEESYRWISCDLKLHFKERTFD